LKRFTSALRARLSNFPRNRPGKVLHVTAGAALPSEGAKFRGITEQGQRLLRVVADSFENASETI